MSWSDAGRTIYLEVELVGTNKVQERVLDSQTEELLNSVLVSFQRVETLKK